MYSVGLCSWSCSVGTGVCGCVGVRACMGVCVSKAALTDTTNITKGRQQLGWPKNTS